MSVWIIAGIIGFYAAAVVLTGWWWIQQKWSEHQHGDRCACGLFGLEDIHAMHTTVAVHERDMCAPKREMIP